MPKDPQPLARPVQFPLPFSLPCARCGTLTTRTSVYGRPWCEKCIKPQRDHDEPKEPQG